MLFLRQSTAVTVKSYAILASDDLAAETGLTIQKADVRLSKNGGNMAAASADQGTSDAGAPHDELGKYDISLNTTDTNTLGTLDLVIAESSTLPCEMQFMVIPANAYDSLVAGSDALDVSLIQWLGTAPNALTSGRVEALVGAMANNVITSAAINDGAIAAAKLADAAITAAKLADDAITAAKIAADAIGSSELAATAAAEIAAAIRTELTTELGRIDAAISSRLDSASYTAPDNTGIGAIKAETDKLADTLEDDGGTYRFTANALEQAPAGGGGGGDATEANQDIIIAHLEDIKGAGWDSGESLKAIGDKTTNLPSDPADASVVAGNVSDAQTAILAAISALNNLSSAQAQSAAAAALTAYDPPTRAEATSDKNEALAAIAALNNIAASDVLTQVNTALNTAISELGVGAPSATPTIRTALMFLYMALRNRSTTTATAQTVQNDAGTTIATAAVSDDGSTFTKGEFS